MICGLGRSGKDTLAEFMKNDFRSSSKIALDLFIWEEWGHIFYKTKEECFEDRVNFRMIWKLLISQYNALDPARLGRKIFEVCDTYAGCRSFLEFNKLKQEGIFDYSIWVHSDTRLQNLTDTSCDLIREDCDIPVRNDDTLEVLKQKAHLLDDFIEHRERLKYVSN